MLRERSRSNVRVLAEARMEMRLSPEDKALINQAASLRGVNATAFTLSAALSEARRTLGENSSVELSLRDRLTLRTALQSPAQPTTALAEAIARHRGLDGALARLFQSYEPAHHDLREFDCGSDALNEFLQRNAATQDRLHLARVYVLTDALAQDRVRGYYTLAAVTLGDSMAAADTPAPLAALRLGRLALDRSLHGRGLEPLLLADAIQRAAEAADSLAVYALLATTRDEREAGWYETFGFRRFVDDPSSLFLPLAALG